jgi:urease accessory protein
MKTVFAILATLVALPAAAHAEPGMHAAFTAGLVHPLTGLDHLLGMLAIGLWSAQQKRSTSLPMVALAAMALGALASSGAALPLAGELSLAAGVVLLGALLACGMRVPAWAATALVASLSLVHGQAHGAELQGAASAAGYLIASALRVCTGQLAARLPLQRPAGLAIGALGLGLLAGFA